MELTVRKTPCFFASSAISKRALYASGLKLKLFLFMPKVEFSFKGTRFFGMYEEETECFLSIRKKGLKSSEENSFSESRTFCKSERNSFGSPFGIASTHFSDIEAKVFFKSKISLLSLFSAARGTDSSSALFSCFFSQDNNTDESKNINIAVKSLFFLFINRTFFYGIKFFCERWEGRLRRWGFAPMK